MSKHCHSRREFLGMTGLAAGSLLAGTHSEKHKALTPIPVTPISSFSMPTSTPSIPACRRPRPLPSRAVASST